MLYISVFIFFIAIFTIIYVGLTYLSKDMMIFENRIKQIKEIDSINQEALSSKPFSERTIMPYYHFLVQILLKITPNHKIVVLNKKLERAGLLKNNAEKWLFDKSMIILIVTGILSLLAYMLEPDALKTLIIAIISILFMNVFLNFYLSKKIEIRRKKILKDLPYILDLIMVSVEAGLSFDGAITRVVNNINGELCDEFAKCLKEIRMGIPRRIALKNMSGRCEVKELSMLNTSIIQADELGVSLGNVLRIEASNLREHRKQVTREKAMKVPIKMLFPLIFFIFPSIFIIILGPAVIQIFNIFLR